MEKGKQELQKKFSIKKILLFAIIIVAIIGLGGSIYFYKQYQAIKKNPNIEAQQKTAQLISELGKIMELPKGETPTIATISDKSKLIGQPFFKNAENGDVLFAYTNSMEAILYRPGKNQIINVAPISINQGAAAPATLKIAYYNGTNIAGIYSRIKFQEDIPVYTFQGRIA